MARISTLMCGWEMGLVLGESLAPSVQSRVDTDDSRHLRVIRPSCPQGPDLIAWLQIGSAVGVGSHHGLLFLAGKRSHEAIGASSLTQPLSGTNELNPRYQNEKVRTVWSTFTMQQSSISDQVPI
jgi:hypothetical protein